MIDLSEETEALAKRLADARSVTVDVAVRQALEVHAQAAGIAVGLARTGGPSPEAVAARRARIERDVRDIAAMPILDRRSPREIMDDLNAP